MHKGIDNQRNPDGVSPRHCVEVLHPEKSLVGSWNESVVRWQTPICLLRQEHGADVQRVHHHHNQQNRPRKFHRSFLSKKFVSEQGSTILPHILIISLYTLFVNHLPEDISLLK